MIARKTDPEGDSSVGYRQRYVEHGLARLGRFSYTTRKSALEEQSV